MSGLGKFYLTVGIICCLVLMVLAGIRIYKAVEFDFNCESYLKRAADANTVEIAVEQLDKAIKYCEANNLTEGIVSIFFKNPKNDIGFWYENLKASKLELERLDPNASQLEKTNVLMKLRETLLDSEEKSSTVTFPAGISIYPHNVGFFWGFTVSGILAVVFFALMYWQEENYY